MHKYITNTLVLLYMLFCVCIIGCSKQKIYDPSYTTTFSHNMSSTDVKENEEFVEDLKRLTVCGVDFVEQPNFVFHEYVPHITDEQFYAYKNASFEKLSAEYNIKYLKGYNDTYYSLIQISKKGPNNTIEWPYYKLTFNNNLELISAQRISECNATISMLNKLSADMSQADVITFLGGGSESSANGFPDDSTFHLIKDNEKWYCCQVIYENGKFLDYLIETL